MQKDKIDALCKYLDENVAQRYPISNKELSESTDYIKNGYLKMLAVVLQQAGNISESQLGIFKRIHSGVDSEQSVEEYLRMALDIEIEDYVNFSDECKELSLKYRWVLDAMILTCIQEKIPDQIRLLVQFCESLGLSKEEVKYIATMAKAILGMSEADYVTAYEVKEASVPDTVFLDYMYLISRSCICHNEHMTIFQPSYYEEFSVQILDKIQEINTPCIKIIDADLDLSACQIIFFEKEKVILESCHLKGSERKDSSKSTIIPLSFHSCEKVVINNCSFESFTTRIVFLNTVNYVRIKDCSFSNCQFYHSLSGDWDKLGGVIYSDKPSGIGRLDLINSSFTNCGGANSHCPHGYKSAFISNVDSSVNHCSFKNCWHYHDEGKKVDYYDEKRTMFTTKSMATNCSYENSAEFN